VGADRFDHLLRVAALAQDPLADVQVRILGRVPLVVEVVEQPDDTPPFDLVPIGDAEPAGVGAHGLLDRAAVLAERVALGELVQERLGVGPGRHARMICWR